MAQDRECTSPGAVRRESLRESETQTGVSGVAPDSARPSPGALLRLRNFLLLSLAGAMSQFGDRLTHMLLVTVIGQQSPGRLFAYSQGALVFALPTLILSPFAGVLVDRWAKRAVLYRTHLIQTGVLLLAAPAIIVTRSFIPFWVALFLFFGLDVFNNTASPALLPALVPQSGILTANSIYLTFARVATVLGMVLGGFLIKWTGWSYGLVLDSWCHLTAAMLVLGMARTAGHVATVPPLASSLSRTLSRFFRELAEVGRVVAGNGLVAFVLASLAVSTFVSAVAYTILIYLVQQELKLGTGGVGVFAGILAVGMIAGAAAMSFLPRTLNRGRVVAGIILLYGLLFLAGPWLLTAWYMAAVALVSGIAFSCLSIVQTTMLQEQVPAETRGRIFSTREFITNAVFILTTLITGALGDLTSVKTALLIIGSILSALGTAGLFWVSRLRSAPTGPAG